MIRRCGTDYRLRNFGVWIYFLPFFVDTRLLHSIKMHGALVILKTHLLSTRVIKKSFLYTHTDAAFSFERYLCEGDTRDTNVRVCVCLCVVLCVCV